MKRITLIAWALLAVLTAGAGERVRRGTVRCEGRGVEGVVVTDGTHCVRTDARGRFALPRTEDARFVYLSTPAGYDSPVEEHVVRFFLPVDDARRSYDFELRREAADRTRHGFVVVADPQVFARGEFALLARAADDIRATAEEADRPFHGICVGDLIAGDHTFYPQYNETMARTGLAFRNAMGNHDMKIWGRSYESSLRAFEDVYGPSHYSYNVGRVHYVVLNDNFFIGRDWYYIGYLEERQLAWLERDLACVAPGSTVVVAIHIPTAFRGKEGQPFDYAKAAKTLANYKALHRLLEPYRAHIVSGHLHTTANCEIGERLYEHNVAALSGAWWQGAICTDGTPAGYAVFEIDGDRVSWYYKSVGLPREVQMKLYDGGDDPAFAGRIVANVWNCDAAWRVEMRADGGEPVAMERTTAADPQARTLYADPSQLVHKWITVVPSDHYYAAPLPAGTRHVEVTARDRFGNVWRAEKKIEQ